MAIEPDTKDWTWVLERPCPACGFDARAVAVDEFADRFGENARLWRELLSGTTDAARRPAPEVWSLLEYGCHVCDVHRTCTGRVRLLLDCDDPVFANWDQDATAIEDRYAEQDPAVVATELFAAATHAVSLYGSISGDEWTRPGRRSNGSVFTVASLGRYHLHDVVHHLHDVAADGTR